MTIRIIAKLDVKPPYVVKPVHFEGLRKMGSPLELAKKYYDFIKSRTPLKNHSDRKKMKFKV